MSAGPRVGEVLRLEQQNNGLEIRSFATKVEVDGYGIGDTDADTFLYNGNNRNHWTIHKNNSDMRRDVASTEKATEDVKAMFLLRC